MRLKDCKFMLEWNEEDNEWIGKCDQFPILLFTDKSIKKAFDGIVGQALQSVKEIPTDNA